MVTSSLPTNNQSRFHFWSAHTQLARHPSCISIICVEHTLTCFLCTSLLFTWAKIAHNHFSLSICNCLNHTNFLLKLGKLFNETRSLHRLTFPSKQTSHNTNFSSSISVSELSLVSTNQSILKCNVRLGLIRLAARSLQPRQLEQPIWHIRLGIMARELFTLEQHQLGLSRSMVFHSMVQLRFMEAWRHRHKEQGD